MANVYWRGGAAPAAKVITLTIGGTIEVGDLFTVTIGAKTFSFAATSTDAATNATAFAAAWNLLSTTSYQEFTGTARGWTAAATSGGSLTLTAKTAGFNGSVTLATTESNGAAADAQTFGQSTTTAASGPNDWSVAANWSGGAVPVNSDVVYVENSSVSILYGLDQSSVALSGLYIAQSFTGSIGLPRNYSSAIPEWLDQYLKVSATTCQIGAGDGDGSGRIKINFGTNQTAVTVLGSGTAAETGVEAVLLLGTHASNTVTADSGSVGIAVFGGEAATVATLRVTDAATRCGDGVTLTTVQHAGLGTLQINSAATTIDKEEQSGTLQINGSGAYTTINARGTGLFYGSSGTIGTLNGGARGDIDFDYLPTPRTITDSNFSRGFRLKDRSRTTTWTNPTQLLNCQLGDVTWDIGSNRTVKVA